MTDVLHVVEPMLESEAGHCHSFVESLCRSRGADGPSVCVWAGRGARLSRLASSGIVVRPYFSRRLRRVREYVLLSKLLREPGRIFLTTAGRTDLALLLLASRGHVPPGKVFLYFHWLRETPRKMASLRKMALRLPTVTVLGPTPSVADRLAECGFADVRLAAYPIAPAGDEERVPEGGFTHLVYAGAARQDKGFSRVVDLVAFLRERGSDIPVVVQTSPDHYGKYDDATKADIERLGGCGYPYLRILPDTLGKEAYGRMFDGAVCLQPYDRADFADRVSGITLDALVAGCPVVATTGTWMARVVERFGAGLAVDEPGAESLFEAATAVIGDFERYRRNAAEGGRRLLEENSARRLLAIVTGT